MLWIEAEKFTPQQDQQAVLAVRVENNPNNPLTAVHAIFMDGNWWAMEDGGPDGGEVYPPVFVHPIEPMPKA